jgi:4-amino-4-deoxy-L-arabinose transferase-like glycosyltransferase
MPTATLRRWIYALMALALCVHISGLFVTLMQPDAALYASVAKTMAERNDYVRLFVEGKDWLDKPHFPFWMAAFSFELFGINTLAYKLPAFLFVLLGSVYTYLLGKKLHSKDTGLWAALFLLTAEHILISNNDVRAEPYLTGLVVGSVYHFYCAYHDKKHRHLVIGALLAACAVMTKGPFVLITIGGAIIVDLMGRRQWRELFHWRWLMAILLTTLFITPELYCLWLQFDTHPEKIVFGRTGVSGIQFFLWDSQFGRFFNTGPIRGESDKLFFLHTTLWAFLPWSILLFAGIYNFIRNAVRKKQAASVEWLLLGAVLPTFLIFSLSQFQLSFYLNFLFPFFALITAEWLVGRQDSRWAGYTQWALSILLLSALLGLHFFYQPGRDLWLVAGIMLSLLLIYRQLGKTRLTPLFRSLLMSAFAVLVLNLYLNTIFYPSLLRYQSGSEAAVFVNQHYPQHQLYVYHIEQAYALDFYLDHIPQKVSDSLPASLPQTKPALLYMGAGQEEGWQSRGWKLTKIRSFDNFPVTKLDLTFLNPATRPTALNQFSLYRLEK